MKNQKKKEQEFNRKYYHPDLKLGKWVCMMNKSGMEYHVYLEKHPEGYRITQAIERSHKDYHCHMMQFPFRLTPQDLRNIDNLDIQKNNIMEEFS